SAHYYSATYSNIESKLATRGFFCLFFYLVNFLMFVAKRVQERCHASAPFFVIRVALFLSSQCVTLVSNFLCKITIFIYLQIDTI
ncbi:MAG: hypothetical protein ACEY3B_03790, partial [Wolbachia sp.]